MGWTVAWRMKPRMGCLSLNLLNARVAPGVPLDSNFLLRSRAPATMSGALTNECLACAAASSTDNLLRAVGGWLPCAPSLPRAATSPPLPFAASGARALLCDNLSAATSQRCRHTPFSPPDPSERNGTEHTSAEFGLR